MIHLDTSFLIRGLVPGTTQDQALRNWLRRGDALAMSTVAWAEFLCVVQICTVRNVQKTLFLCYIFQFSK